MMAPQVPTFRLVIKKPDGEDLWIYPDKRSKELTFRALDNYLCSHVGHSGYVEELVSTQCWREVERGINEIVIDSDEHPELYRRIMEMSKRQGFTPCTVVVRLLQAALATVDV